MATENRGGFRPTAPQNQTGVSANGGNGSKNGQPTRLAAGGEWGSRGESKIIQDAAAMKVASSSPSIPSAVPNMPPPTPLTAMSARPDESIMSGSSMPGGLGPEALNLPPSAGDDGSAFAKTIASYSPALSFIASRPNTSPETRRALGLLMNGIE